MRASFCYCLDRSDGVMDQYWFSCSATGNRVARNEYGYDADGNVPLMVDLTESWTLDSLVNWISETVNCVAQDDTTDSENELTAAAAAQTSLLTLIAARRAATPARWPTFKEHPSDGLQC